MFPFVAISVDQSINLTVFKGKFIQAVKGTIKQHTFFVWYLDKIADSDTSQQGKWRKKKALIPHNWEGRKEVSIPHNWETQEDSKPNNSWEMSTASLHVTVEKWRQNSTSPVAGAPKDAVSGH